MKIRVARMSDAKEIRTMYDEFRSYEMSLLKGEIKKIQSDFKKRKRLSEIKKYLKSKKYKIFAHSLHNIGKFCNNT